MELFGGNSPVVIVQNEKGERSKDLDKKSIQAKFSNVKENYAVNLLTCDNLPTTKTALEFFIQQLPHIGQKLPKQWVKIRTALEEMERKEMPYISLEKYYEVCSNHQIPEEERALSLSQYLHDLGVFLHFQEDDLLRNVVILQNEWATDAVYKVLDCESVKQAKGRFTRDDLKTIWGDDDCKEKYKNMHGPLLALMKNFELCYELEGEKNTYLAPQLFAETQPDYEWEKKDNLILRYKYGFMPKGLLSRFTVRKHHHVKDLKKAWKNGVVLQRVDTQAEVVSLYAQQEIRIRVRGNDNKAFLDIIVEELDKLHGQYEGIKVDKLIPCICPVCLSADWKGKYYFKYEVLRKAFNKGKREVECQESFDPVNLDRLINDTLVAERFEKYEKEKLLIDEKRKRKTEEQIVVNIKNENIINKTENSMTDNNQKSTEPTAIYGYTIAVVIIGALLFIALGDLPILKGILFSAVLIILIALVGTLQLKNDKNLSEKNFMEIFTMILKKVPPLSWFGKKGEIK